MTDTCPTCAAPVLAPASGLLDPQPSRLGVHRADGSAVSRADVLRAHAAGEPTGHHRHRCGQTAQPEPEQGELFPISDPADKSRSGS